MARVLLISDEEAVGLLWGAHAGGHEVFVTGVRRRNPTVSRSPKAREFLPLPDSASFLDPDQFDELADLIADRARQVGAEVIVPTSFESVKFAIARRDRLESAAPLVPLASMDRVNLLDDKSRFYDLCRRHGLPHPPSCLLESAADLAKPDFQALQFPLLTKPTMGVAEQGIERFDNPQALEARLQSAEPGFFPVLAQEWFDGDDIDFNAYALNGEVAVSSVMQTHVYRGTDAEVRLIEFVRHEEVSGLGHDMVRHAQFTGPMNVDLRIRRSDGKLMFIEVNPRFWGRSMACLIDGLIFVDAAIRLTADPNWRCESRADGRVWASSIVPLVRGTLRGDRQAMQYLGRVSAIQLWYQLQTRWLARKARADDAASETT